MNHRLIPGVTGLLLAAASLSLGGCAPQSSVPAAAASVAAAVVPTTVPVAAPVPKDPLLSAVGIGVSDLDKSVKFYTEVMGMKILTTYKISYMNEVVVGYPDAESYIVLMHWIDNSKRNYKDNPVKIVTRTKDPVALAARIKAAGYEITREPQPSSEVGGNVVGFAKDPDGYMLELLPLRAAAAATPAPAATAATPAAAPTTH